MIGDKKRITKKDKNRATFLIPKILQLGDRKIIAIQGGSGTSKSE